MYIQQMDHRGNFPLHASLDYHMSPFGHVAMRLQSQLEDPTRNESIYMKLIDVYPAAIKNANRNGNYPLHLACDWTHHAVFWQLIETYPKRDKKGT
jgi:hypothetical protein